MLALVKKGMTREDAYKIVQTQAMRAWNEKQPFLNLLLENDDVKKHINEEDLKKLFDINIHLKRVDDIFTRVFD